MDKLKLLTVEETSNILGITPGTLYNWVHSEKIPYVKIGRKLRFKLTEIEKFIQNNSHNEDNEEGIIYHVSNKKNLDNKNRSGKKLLADRCLH